MTKSKGNITVDYLLAHGWEDISDEDILIFSKGKYELMQTGIYWFVGDDDIYDGLKIKTIEDLNRLLPEVE